MYQNAATISLHFFKYNNGLSDIVFGSRSHLESKLIFMSIYQRLLKKFKKIVQSESTVIIGLGNPDRADDGAGMQIVSRLKLHFPERVFLESEKSAESIVLDLLENDKVLHVLFIDATDFGGNPGEARLFDHHDAKKFIPAISTHKVPMTILMDLLVQHHKNPYLLGIQPLNLNLFGELSSEVRKTINELEEFILDM